MNEETTKEPLAVTVGDQSFRIRVAAAEGERYRRSERTANETLKLVQSGAGALTGSRALAMALFQLAVELEEARDSQRQTQESRDRLRTLISRIDQATGNQTVATKTIAGSGAETESKGRG